MIWIQVWLILAFFTQSQIFYQKNIWCIFNLSSTKWVPQLKHLQLNWGGHHNKSLASLVPIFVWLVGCFSGGPDQVRSFQFRMIELQEIFMAVWYDVIHFRIPQAMMKFQVRYDDIYVYWWCFVMICHPFLGGFVYMFEQHKQWMETGSVLILYVWRLIWRLTIMLCDLFVPLTFWTFFNGIISS